MIIECEDCGERLSVALDAGYAEGQCGSCQAWVTVEEDMDGDGFGRRAFTVFGGTWAA